MGTFTYKKIDLFGNEEMVIATKKKLKPDLFSDHDAFVEKFEIKKTTDDCYTPEAVYSCVLEYVGQNFDLSDRQIIRPFYPGGDYEALEYPANAVVIDNPPFSIITKIARFYLAKGISFFLFAPHLTLFSSDIDCTHIVVGGDVTYENGANVKTSFLSNMFGNAKVIGNAELHDKLEAINQANKVNLPKYVYPENVLTVSMVSWMVEKGISFRLNKGDMVHCRALDSQKKHGKSLFGSGFLLSNKAAAEKAAAEKAAAEKAAAEKAAAEKAAAEKDNVIAWELSEREKAIIEAMRPHV